MKAYYTFILIFFTSLNSFSQDFIFSENCEKAYKNIIALKIDSGKYFIEADKQINADNGIHTLLTNYIHFLEIYTTNSASAYKLEKSGFETRLKEVRKANSNSPYYLFCQAEIHLHSAVLHIKFGEYFAALIDVRKAVKKLEENMETYPNFLPNKKSLGTLYVILGSIPAQYQTGLSFFGLNGNVIRGMNMLEGLVAEKDFVFQHEAATIYAFLQLHIANNPDKAWKVLQENNFFKSNNLMDAYSIGHIGIHGNYNDLGIKALLTKPKGSEYLKFPYLDFLLALGKTYRLDTDANIYFKLFLKENKGEDYIKSAYHKMAWNALLENNLNNYNNYLSKIPENGRAVIDTDKQAQNEAKNNTTPNIILLKSRLLTDGKYLTNALNELNKIEVTELTSTTEKTEYFYRYGRIYDKQKQFDLAEKYYELTIQNGVNVSSYFAANSSYLLGYIYENKAQYSKAKLAYQSAIDLDGFEYNNSIDQKAKAGLNRVKNK